MPKAKPVRPRGLIERLGEWTLTYGAPWVGALVLAGETMMPISWQEMICPKTKQKEFRKCAKPANLS